MKKFKRVNTNSVTQPGRTEKVYNNVIKKDYKKLEAKFRKL